VSLQIKKLASVDAFNELRPEWEQIESAITPRTPFTSPLWNELWWQHLSRDGLAQRDEFYVHAIREQHRLIAIAPMMITVAPAVGPLRTRRLHYFGADPNLTEVRSLVCRAEDEERVVAALSDYLDQQRGAWDWLRWSGIRAAGGAQRWLDTHGGIRWEEPVQNYWLNMPATWAEFRGSRTRNIKESLRKCYNSLKRAGHQFQFSAVGEPRSSVAALERFLELHAARANSAMPVRHADCFARKPARAFIQKYCAAMAERGELRIFQLEINGTLVASRLGFVLGRELYLYYSGYLPDWGKYSVMTTLLAETLKWAIGQGFQIVNLSTGTDNSKLRWGPQQTLLSRCVQQGVGWRRRLAFRIYTWLEGI